MKRVHFACDICFQLTYAFTPNYCLLKFTELTFFVNLITHLQCRTLKNQQVSTESQQFDLLKITAR